MGPKKAKTKMPVDGVDTTSMSREQLEAFCIRLREELDREREERNFFQLERDKLRTFWEITRQQLEESRAQQRNQDRAIDELEEKHQAEIKVYKQKVKHLLYEHQCNLSELQVEGMVSLKQAQDDYNAMEQQLLKDKKELKEEIHERELKHLEEIRQLKIDHSAEVSRIREQLESDAAELEKKYEARLTNQAEEQAMREKMEQAELETRKNQHIVDLTKQHETAFQEMKNYYNDITLNNLALISTLKEQIEELKSNHDRMEKQLTACQAENKKLAEPFKQAQSELGLLRRQLTTYEQDKVTLANTKQRLSLVTKELEDLRWENDVLELRFEKVEKERDRLHAEFVGAVLDVQQKSGLKGALLEKRMASMRTGVSQRNGEYVTGCSRNSENKETRPASAPLQNRPLSNRRSPDLDVTSQRFQAHGVRGRGRLDSKSISRRIASKSTERDDGWSQVLSESGHFRVSSRVTEPVTYPPPCICGQHGSALSFNLTKHRYYPQILDSIRRSLSPIHSQEHPSDASIHGSLDKPAPGYRMGSRRLRPLSATRSDGRDRAFSKEKSLNIPPVSCSNTATSSSVFRQFIPLPPRPDLPWLHGVKSRYFSVRKRKERAVRLGPPPSIDVEIQTSEKRFNCVERKRTFLGTKSDLEDQTYFSQLIHNPFQLSYTVGHMDRKYAAIVTSPKCDDAKGDITVALSTWTEDPASLAPWLSNALDEDSMPNRRSRKLVVSPPRVIDIESEGSEISSPAMNINASHEDTGTAVSSLATPSQLDVKSEPSRSIDIDIWPSRESSVERKHERTLLKRKFKATVVRRLKLKLMICSYMHRHDEEGDVNFVHPSARKVLVEPTSLRGFADPSYDLVENSLESGDTKGPVAEESQSSVSANGKPLYQYFCCVCHSEMTSLWDPAEEDQVCCEDCQKKANVLLVEYERSQATMKEEFDVSCVISGANIICQQSSAQVEGAMKPCLAKCDSFDTDRSSKRQVTFCEDDDVISPAKHHQDSFKTVFENEANAVMSEAGLVDGLKTEWASKPGYVEKLKEDYGKERDVLFTLSSVQTAIRSAMSAIAFPADCSLPQTPTITSSQGKTSPTPLKTPTIYSYCKLKDPHPSQSNTDLQLNPHLPPEATDACSPQLEHQDLLADKSSSDLQQHPSVFPTTSNLQSVSPPSSVFTVDDFGNSDLLMDQTTAKLTSTPTKQFYVCPLTVPRGILKENTKLVYTEYPVQTYDFPAKKMACVSKQKNMLVFYEVSKTRNPSRRFKSKTPNDDSETKDPLSLPRVSRVDTRPISSSQFMLRPSRSSLLVSDHTPVVDIRQAENKRLASVGATANLSKSQSPIDQKLGQPKLSDGKFDLLMRRRRQSWILSEKSSSSKGVRESDKFRHRPEQAADEDEVRLTRYNECAFAANREKRCQCFKRGSKCNCSLLNHLHIRPLILPRQLSKGSDCESSSPDRASKEPSPFWCSSLRSTNLKSSRPKKITRHMSTLIEDSSESFPCQDGTVGDPHPSSTLFVLRSER